MQKLKQKIKILLGTRILLQVLKNNRYIFVFHDISDPDEHYYSEEYSMPISCFKSQINLLEEIYEIIPLEEIVTNKGLSTRKNYAAITFDDGFYSVFKTARPILNKKNIPYAVFLNGAAINDNQLWFSNIQLADENYKKSLLDISQTTIFDDENAISAIYSRGKFNEYFRLNYKRNNSEEKIYMDSSDIMALQREGVLIGSHSYDHFVLSRSSEEVLNLQITDNNLLLQKIKGKGILHFAIPFGKKKHYNDTSINILKQSGHQYIYSTNPNKFSTTNLNNSNFIFPRISLKKQEAKELLFIINRAIFKKYDL